MYLHNRTYECINTLSNTYNDKLSFLTYKMPRSVSAYKINTVALYLNPAAEGIAATQCQPW